MNCKGSIYSIAIAGMAIVLLGLTIFSAQSILLEEESDDYLTIMGDVRMVWQNQVLLFEDAFEDAAAENGCALTQNTLESNYLDSVISEVNSELEPGVECSYEGTLSGAGPLTYEVEIVCEQELIEEGKTQFEAEYSKTLTFTKNCT